jgi:hypothetical protein
MGVRISNFRIAGPLGHADIGTGAPSDTKQYLAKTGTVLTDLRKIARLRRTNDEQFMTNNERDLQDATCSQFVV